MLNVYLGNFHPDLEDALSQHIAEIKKKDQLSQIAIVTPSDHIRKRLKTLLTIERGMCLMGVHFLTFHTLSLKLYEEKYGLMSQKMSHMICDDFFFTEMIRHILGTDASETNLFRHFAETPEGCSAIWRTIRELREARVEPDNMIEAIRDGLFDGEDYEKIIALLVIYKEFLLRKRDKSIIDYSDLPDMASEVVPSSAYLRKFDGIIYYGFYDLTQVQYDLMRAIVQHYPVTIFFPHAEDVPALSSTRRFYDSFIQGLMNNYSKVIRCPDADSLYANSKTLFPVKSSLAIINTSGMEDEVAVAAKTILRLVEEDGYSFSEIGVAARDINEYVHIIKRIFDAHKIPFMSTGTEPAGRYPLVKTVQILISLHENDYRRADIIDIASSHCCQKKIKSFCPENAEPRPDKWDVVTRLTGISKGQKEWDRLDKYLKDGLVLRKTEKEDEPEAMVSGEEISGLKNLVTSLIEDFSSLPPKGSWSGYAGSFTALIRKYIDIDSSGTEYPEAEGSDRDYFNAAGSVIEALSSLRSLELVSAEVTLSEFISTFSRSLENMEYKVCDKDIAGVQVLDAMAARAIPFRVLFVIGMNEKTFPRNIREDPLLRDSVRQVMERVLGYKITEKLSGFEEEKLLFYLLINSAKERLYISYQRTDDSGETKIPSWYISEVKMAYPVKEYRIPRRLSDKFTTTELYDYSFLTPHELSTRLILEDTDPTAIMLKFNLNYKLYYNGTKSIAQHEKMKSGLTEFDGITGVAEEYWSHSMERGISPTSLEMFARCPFSYFARHLLGLNKIERPETIFEIHPVDAGNICHSILKRFYSVYSMARDFDVAVSLKDAASAEFAEFEQNYSVGYPVIWEIEQERFLSLLKDLIDKDLQELSVSGFQPHIFEAGVKGHLTVTFHEDSIYDIPIHGYLDRMDIKKDHDRFRIIDYKFKMGASARSEDKDIITAAVRGQILQPPMYILMAAEYLKDKEGIENPLCEDVRFYYLAPNWPNSNDEKVEDRSRDFPGDCWQSGLGEYIKSTIKLLLEGIRDGLFFILPGNYCKSCDYSTICRKNHFPTRLRAKKDDKITKAYRDLRKKKIGIFE